MGRPLRRPASLYICPTGPPSTRPSNAIMQETFGEPVVYQSGARPGARPAIP